MAVPSLPEVLTALEVLPTATASSRAMSTTARPAPDDLALVTALLGRIPKTAFEVVVRADDGAPVVTRNAPFERDGTPMPTRYWLLPSSKAAAAIGRLEAAGGVRQAEAAVDAADIERAHRSYANDRDAAIARGWTGPRPSGGVGGTRTGTKCLHAHYAYFLAGGDDAVGRWVFDQLPPDERDVAVPMPVSAEPVLRDRDRGAGT